MTRMSGMIFLVHSLELVPRTELWLETFLSAICYRQAVTYDRQQLFSRRWLAWEDRAPVEPAADEAHRC